MSKLTDRLQSEITERQQTLQLVDRFPDLHEHRNRWNTIRLCSPSANALCTDAEIRHNCGCCDDSPLEIWPYLEANGSRIYADPIPFTVGEKGGYRGGEVPYDGWQKKMQDAHIPQAIIDKVQAYFDACQPDENDEEETE